MAARTVLVDQLDVVFVIDADGALAFGPRCSLSDVRVAKSAVLFFLFLFVAAKTDVFRGPKVVFESGCLVDVFVAVEAFDLGL